MTTLSEQAKQINISWSVAVLPVRGNQKRPEYSWSNLEANPQKCLEWWDSAAEVTGAWMYGRTLPDGLLVLDCDFDYQYLEAVLVWLGMERPEVEARSASGRCHLFLKAPRTPMLGHTTAIPPGIIGGSVGNIEVRSCQFKSGLMMIGSSAKTKSGSIGEYTSSHVDQIWSLRWSEVTEAEVASMSQRLGGRHKSTEAATAGDKAKTAIDALRHGHIEQIMLLHQGGIDRANDWATTYGNILGRLVRSDVASPSILAQEAWDVVLASADEKTADSLTNSERHKQSFTRKFEEAAREEQAARRRELSKQMQAHTGDVQLSEEFAEVEAASLQFFGGGVKATLVRQAGDSDEWRISVLGVEHMADPGAILSNVDLEHPLTQTIQLDHGFTPSAGVEALQRISLLLGLPPERMTRFRESKHEFVDLKNLLTSFAFVDRRSTSFSESQIECLVEQFDAAEYRSKVEALDASERSRHAWILAPRSGHKRVGPSPYIVEHEGSLYVAITPCARKHLDPERLKAITRGSEPDHVQFGPNKQEVRLYSVRSEESGDA